MVAAVIGAAFIISLQIAAILSTETLSRFSFLQSEAAVALAPHAGSFVWWPARAILGDPAALAAVLGISAALLVAAIVVQTRG